MPVDYATYCAAEVARDAALFLVDQREQFLANRDAGLFDDYPDPTATLGEAILAGDAASRARVGSWRRTWASAWPTSCSGRHRAPGRPGRPRR